MTQHWRSGNRVSLLVNGDAFFPRVFEAISRARHEVLIETFLLFEDEVGRRLREVLVAAAARGVRVHLTIDGYGSPNLSADFVQALLAAGVKLHVFDPCPTVFGVRLKIMRRMHRKIVVIDAERAFVGGINFSVQHLAQYGERAKQDYAVELEGPVVVDIWCFARVAVREPPTHQERAAVAHRTPGGADVLFAVRDNAGHRRDIEHEYRTAIGGARRQVLIANAYFIPSFGLLHEMRHAVRRGVRVTLIVQGKPDQQYAIAAARRLYGYLVPAGVDIREYEERAFHGKIALADDDWATVGSTNLDPLSLALNLEANVFISDRAFNDELRAHMQALAAQARPIDPSHVPRRPVRDRLIAWALFRFTRRFHRWAERMPRHAPKIASLASRGPDRAPIDPARRALLHWIARAVVFVFAIGVAWLLVRYARSVQWREVGNALAGYDPLLLAASVALAALAFVLYSIYDVLARTYTGHHLSTRRIMAIGAISYAFNLNLGSLVGSAGFRFRLYSRAGLNPARIARIIGFSIATNWIGYVAVAGVMFAAGLVVGPEQWSLGAAGLRALGVVLIAGTLGYLLACAVAHDRVWMVREHEIRLPSLQVGLLQIVTAAAHWLTASTIMYLLLQRQIDFPTVLGCMLLAAIAGAMAHIPAGLGVLEVVFLTFLASRLPPHTVLAALLAYRGIYYIGPLLLALVAYGRLEAMARPDARARVPAR